MERILLASYTIKINERGNYQLLNQFNSSDDFLVVIRNFCSFIFENTNHLRELTGEERIHLTLEREAIFNSEDRCIYGFFSSGVSGERYRIVDTQDNSSIRILPHHAAFRDVFFYFYIPRYRDTGYLVLQRKAKFGIKTLLKKAIVSYMNQQGFQNYRLDMFNILINEVYQRMMQFGKLKKVDLIKQRIPNSLERYISGETVAEQIPGVFKTTFASKTSLPHAWKSFLDRLFNQNSSNHDRIMIENIDEQYDEIEFQLELNGKNKTFYVKNSHRIQPDIDVTDEIILENGEPTIESLVSQSRELISEIIEVHPL